MPPKKFRTTAGLEIPSVDEAQMRQVDRIAVEDFSLGILQMMENAGRNLAAVTLEMLKDPPGSEITIFAGTGGNGGGGICAARHLHNRGYKINLILSKAPEAYKGPAKAQLDILVKANLLVTPPEEAKIASSRAGIVIDALIGYSLKGAPRGIVGEYINIINQSNRRVLALDIPSGIDPSTGETNGVFIQAEKTMTLALSKTGLHNPASGKIILADIGISPAVFRSIGINFEPFFGNSFRIPLKSFDE